MAGFSIHCLCWQSLWQELLVYNTLVGGMVINTDHMVKVQTADEQMESLHWRQMAMIVDSLHILGDWESFGTEYMKHIIWCQ